MPTRNVNLTERFDQFVSSQVESGRFQNASEVFRAGLKLLEESDREHKLKLKLLQQAVDIGVQDLTDGRFVDFDDHEAFRASLDRKLAALNQG